MTANIIEFNLNKKPSLFVTWTKTLLRDAGIAILVYLWLIMEAPLMGGFFIFFVMALAVDSLLQFKANKVTPKRPRGFTAYVLSSELALISILAATGHLGLSSVLLARLIFNETVRFKRVQCNPSFKSPLNSEPKALSSNAIIVKASKLIEIKSSQDSIPKAFNMDYFSLPLIESTLKNNEFSQVFIINLYKGRLEELKGIVENYPNTQFYITTSNIKPKEYSVVTGTTSL